MRFSRLSLERYGRFEDCELNFRAGAPDLHIIYGANEAGKTTSLAAVSDLLFGFPARSAYNFIFDNSLLRVGAVLEDGGRTLSCRRRKGTIGTLRVDADGPSPRLLGLRDDGRTMVEVGAMSEGTTDQLFLALRFAALEQSVTAGVNLPFLADDLFVNFDDQRAEAGFRVLAEVAKSTQVLFFTHHPHLMAIAKHVVGADLHSECALN